MKSVKMSAKNGSGKGGKVRSMSIHKVANGYTSSIEHEYTGNGEYQSPTENIHETCDELCNHVAATFGEKPNKASMSQAKAGKTAAAEVEAKTGPKEEY